jgi:anaerobic ribonucleoside-triphosphate reductase activating protein
MNGGYSMPINHILTLIKEDEFANVTFSGGDPFYQVDAVTELAKRIKAETDKTIWCYTGFTIEEIREDPNLRKLLQYIDVLVDGPYVEALRNTDLPFRGSENQRIIHIKNEKSN